MTATPLRPRPTRRPTGPRVLAGDTTIPAVRRHPHRLTKRLIDLVGAVLLTIVVLPLAVLVAAAIRLDSRGPVFYRQERVGLDGRPFSMVKFRSMHVDADRLRAELRLANEAAGPLFKLRHDPRVTSVGRLLRRYSLDELPQLWNILRGDMSLVGPRPALVHEVEGYCDRARQRLLVVPGLTGPWQVGGRSDLDWDDGIALDLSYVHDWTPATDAIVLARTVRAVVRPVGAY
ncbi:sugar transferase [Frigoribacterium faeni]|uniref:Bacterial sugar transferase domain-containing protein n=1 Tax=Frigoribacterium faeni TaxID=145483 RepID=A0ABQ0UQ61_9MICO|nr:sugar transferase [Frigoribacterium faeni]GEK83035.1 hypothetical protein FFA01_13440 [Frigoribacterium faeni]